MLCISRAFSKYAAIKELGKFPPQVQKYLTALGSVELYKSYKGHKPIETIDLLYKTSRKKFNLQTISWQLCPEIQVFTKEIIPRLATFPLVNLVVLIKSCTKLSIDDRELWQAFETCVLLKIEDLQERQLYDVISCFSKSKFVSPKLWEGLERVIINNFSPKHNMQAMVIASIISHYFKLGLLNEKFMLILEEQIKRVSLHLNGTDASKILDVYVKMNVGSDEFYKLICKQVKLTLSAMDTYSATIALINFVKIGRGDQVSDIERHLILLKDLLTFKNIGSIFLAYGKYLPMQIVKEGPRRGFLIELAEYLEKNQRMIGRDDSDRFAVYAVYGLAVARMFEYEQLWERMRKSIESCRLQGNDEALLEEIKSIINENDR